jgi:hypothetical protein
MRRFVCLIAIGIAYASPLAAQDSGFSDFPISLADSAPDWAWRIPQPEGCLAAIPASTMHSVPVFLYADMSPVVDTTITLQADLMAQDVATELAAKLGATPTALPDVTGKLSWYSLPAQISVVAHADGSAGWRAKGSQGDLSAARLMGAAFDSARAKGMARLLWPEQAKADSFVVRLSLWPQYLGDTAASRQPHEHETKFAVFTLMEPDMTPARMKKGIPPPQYPAVNESGRVEGDLLMQFVVETNGRVDQSTIRDLWPDGKPRLSGARGEYYDAFVTSVTDWARFLFFEPMRLGGCPMKQLVQLPLAFVEAGSPRGEAARKRAH